MNKILAARESRAMKWEATKAFHNAHADANGMMSAEDAQTYDRMVDEVDALGKNIERMERQEQIDNEMNSAANEPIRNKIVTNGNAKEGRATDEYKNAFWNVAMRAKHTSYEMRNALEVGTDSEGGFLVPDEFEKTLVAGLQEANIIRPRAHIIRTSSGDRKIPVASTHGTATWIDEEAAYPESDEAFTQVTIGAYKLATMIRVSEELLNDSAFNLESYIRAEFVRRIAAAEEDAFINGNGTGKPTGLVTSATAGITAASATAITADELIDLYHSLKTPYRRNAAFIMNDATVKLIRKLKTAQGEYLWQPSLTAGAPDKILNCPVLTSSYMPTAIATKTAILFGDLGYYWIADRQNRSFKRLNELYAANGQVGFMASERVDAKLVLPEAMVKLTMKNA